MCSHLNRLIEAILMRSHYTIININTLSYIVFRMAQSEPSSGVKGKAIYNKNLSNLFDSFLAGPVLGEHN